MRGGFHFYRGSGLGAARYFDEGHKGAESYYTEDARVAVEIDTWQDGRRVGTATLAEAGDLVKWVEGLDPLTGEVKGIIRTGGPDRQPLRFVETVVNNPKSLSIVASQNPDVARALDRTLARQADEVARYMSEVAVTRIGPRGAQRDVGGLRVETARVTHLTSREGDPHRHVHLMLNTRVMAPDGTWRGLHSAALRQHIGAVQRVGERALSTDADLRRVLARHGYTLGPDGEIDQARGAVRMLSKR
ncbi:MAG: relaxase domain-containing protein, partial [Acidimicrobiales bacterium]